MSYDFLLGTKLRRHIPLLQASHSSELCCPRGLRERRAMTIGGCWTL